MRIKKLWVIFLPTRTNSASHFLSAVIYGHNTVCLLQGTDTVAELYSAVIAGFAVRIIEHVLG